MSETPATMHPDLGRTPRSRAGRWARAIGWNAAFLCAGILILEICFGGWFRDTGLDRLNILRNARMRVKVDALYPSEPIDYTRDAMGLRGRYAALDRIDVLTVGGSTTDQRYVDDGKTWQAVLQSEALKHGKKISVANAGMDGHSTVGHLRSFEVWFPRIWRPSLNGGQSLKPRLVLFYVGINDLFSEEARRFDLRIRERARGNRSRADGVKDRSALYSLYQRLTGTYRVYRQLRIGHSKVDFENVHWTARGLISTSYRRLMADELEAYEKRLDLLFEEVRKLGSTAIFVTQTSRTCKIVDGATVGAEEARGEYDGLACNGADICGMLREINNVTMRSCRRNGGICLDLARDVRFDDSDFYDWYHNTPSGAAKIGRYLAAALRDHL